MLEPRMLNICFTSDENYVQHLAASIASILTNANVDDHLFFWVVDDDITEKSKSEIEKLKKIKDFNISYIKVDEKEFREFPRRKDGLALNSYFLIKVPNILRETNKVLFLDCDIIVRTSLRPLFEIDLKNNYALAVEDINSAQFRKERNIPDEFFYFNSGVLLLDCKKWRKERLEETCFEFVKKNGHKFKFQDQEVLNGVLGGRVGKLGIEWNFQYVNNYIGSFNEEEFKKAKENPAIIHYITTDKPWKKESLNYFGAEYWKYLRLTRFFEENKEILVKKLDFMLSELNNVNLELESVRKKIINTQTELEIIRNSFSWRIASILQRFINFVFCEECFFRGKIRNLLRKIF